MLCACCVSVFGCDCGYWLCVSDVGASAHDIGLGDFSPHVFSVDFADVVVLRVGGGPCCCCVCL